jgi:MFS family permease
MGINESVGYLAVGAISFATGWIAAEYGLRPYPFYLGIGFALSGLILSALAIKDTADHVKIENRYSGQERIKNLFWSTTWKDPNLGSITQAGLINNLNDGLMWGLLPMILLSDSFNLEEVGKVVAVYPIIWGLGQLYTGKLADQLRKTSMLFWGMLLQAAAIALLIPSHSFWQYIAVSAMLGIGTALVYPTLLASISEYSAPDQRAETLGIFRFWRDMGYAIGALLTGLLSDSFGISTAVFAVTGLTFLSALIIQVRMKEIELIT